MDLRRFKPSRRSVGAFAVGGAWFFIVVSILHLLWAIVAKWGYPSGTFKLYHTVVGEVSYDALWLTYTGVLGLIFAILQLLVVSAAAVASTLSLPRRPKVRRGAHLVLCGWSALWALNLVRLALIDGQLSTIGQAALLSVLLGCTVWRAAIGWSPASTTPTADPPSGGPALNPAPADADDADRVSFSARVAAMRRNVAGGLHRMADFTHKQARRVAPNTGR